MLGRPVDRLVEILFHKSVAPGIMQREELLGFVKPPFSRLVKELKGVLTVICKLEVKWVESECEIGDNFVTRHGGRSESS